MTTALLTTAAVEIHDGSRWIRVCDRADLVPGRGVAVLLGTDQVALYLGPDGEPYAVENRDPFSGAHVLARGLLGSRGDVPVLLSPMYRHSFDLRTGVCLDEDFAPDGSPAVLRRWPVRLTEATTAGESR
ncbi:nitrite reductase (NAD(P)H) small subunit [Kitasatospora mediocidica]|uniref:nitrite reductase (NAD(P)H) small subunit n=1 Tax=Kitasatospora mediocidica TaxID=58352 RepID=UPI00055AFC88|nr:nitrite reductase (NAD(P)H) small subunit [Kitasatospora mediocidica]